MKVCNIAMIQIREIYGYVKTFTRIGIPKHWQLSWFRYKTFITFLTFRFSTQGERDTIFTMLTVHPASALNSLTQQTHMHPAANNWTGLALPWFESQLASSSLKSQLTAFFIKPKNPSPSLPGMTSFTSPSPISYPGFLLWHLWLSHIPRVSVNTCSQNPSTII